MSRQVVGYEKGRPVFKDEGPGRARASSGGDSMGGPVDTTFAPAHLVERTGPRLPVAPVERRAMPRLEGAPLPPSEGSGPIERRIATPEERAAWAASSKAKPRKPTAPHGDPFAASRARGAARAGFVPGGTKLPRRQPDEHPWKSRMPSDPSPPEEVPVLTSDVAPPIDTLSNAHPVAPNGRESLSGPRKPPVDLTDRPRIDGSLDSTNDASDLARAEAEALEEAQAIVASDAGENIPDPFLRTIPGRDPDVVTPCEDCAHAIVCRIRPTLVFREIIGFTGLDAGVRVAAVSIDCDHFLAKAPSAPTHRFVHGPAGLVAVRIGRSTSDDHDAHRARIDSCAFCADESFAPQEPPQSVTSPATPDDVAPVVAVAGRPGAGGGRPWLPRDQGDREAMVVEAVRSTSSLEEAGKVIGVTGGRVGQIVQEMRRLERLPADIDALMRQRGGGGRTAPVTAQA